MDEGLLNDLLECSVCLERLDTSSRVLPCQHTFCLKCLKVIVESHKELRCPECRVLVETKVEELPPNVLLMRILEGMRSSAPRQAPGSGLRRSRGVYSQAQPGVPQPTQNLKYLLPHARAIYDFVSKEPSDLSFKKGEFIVLHEKLDNRWFVGECSGKTGMFPISYVQIMVPLQVSPPLCKALYDFRMAAPDEEGCLAFDKGAIITVHRRVDENWVEGRLEQRVGIFPIAFAEFNHAAMELINSKPLNRPVPPIPDQTRAGHTDHRHHGQPTHRFQQMSMSAPTTVQGNYQNVASMSQSHPNYHATQLLIPQPPMSAPQAVSTKSHGVLVSAAPRTIVEPTSAKTSLDLIHFTNVHTKCQQTTIGLQNVPRLEQKYERIRAVIFDSYNTTPVHKAAETTYQNVRNSDSSSATPGNFYSSHVSSDSSSSVNTPSVGVSSTTTPNLSSNTSTCESNEPSVPSSPDNNTERNATVVPTDVTQNGTEENDREANTSAGVVSLNESSTATNTSLNVSLPPSDSPKMNVSSQNPSDQEGASNGNAETRLDAPSSSKNVTRISDPETLLNFGLGLQAVMSPSHGKDVGHTASRPHREHHHREREKRHSLTPSTHLQGNHTQNSNEPLNVHTRRHSAEIVATSLLDHAPERERERERRRRRSRSTERSLPATYVAIYPYRPQKPDELELKKGGVYTVTERCRDGWFKGWSERSQRCGVFPGNYVAPAHLSAHRNNHDKMSGPSSLNAVTPASSTSNAAPSTGLSPAPPPDAPPRARSPLPAGQTTAYPWGSPLQPPQQSTSRVDRPKEKTKNERSTISTGVSLMKRLAAMKKCKSPPPVGVGYSIDNPVFEDTPGPAPAALAASDHNRHPVHVRAPTEGPWQTQHRKSQSLDVTTTKKDRHHSQPVKERFRCIVPYPPNSEYELELKVDDIVIVSKKRGDGWYKGTLQRTGRTGLFPASFVESCPQD